MSDSTVKNNEAIFHEKTKTYDALVILSVLSPSHTRSETTKDVNILKIYL